MATGFTYRHYILKDHLGSWTTITDAEGNVEQELSFDAWGTLRDPETWHGFSQAEPVEAPMFDRGYTGHEHMTAFGLINMNGRCYDPLMSSFLSVDEYVQDPTSAQNFNRYAYCLNNPLKYTDPSGWYYVGGGHSSTSLQGPYECTWTLPERRTIDPSLVMDFLDYWTSFWEGEEFKNGGSGGGVVIKGKDGVLTPYSIGMRYEGNDTFTKTTVDYMNQIAEKSPTAYRMLSELIASGYTYGYTYTIEESEDGKNGYEPNIDTPYYIKYDDDGNSMEFFEPGNGTIKFNLNGQKVFEKRLDEATSKLVCRPYMGLMHELGHAWDHLAGVLANENEIYKGLMSLL